MGLLLLPVASCFCNFLLPFVACKPVGLMTVIFRVVGAHAAEADSPS